VRVRRRWSTSANRSLPNPCRSIVGTPNSYAASFTVEDIRNCREEVGSSPQRRLPRVAVGGLGRRPAHAAGSDHHGAGRVRPAPCPRHAGHVKRDMSHGERKFEIIT